MLEEQLLPTADPVVSRRLGDIEDMDHTMGVFEIGWDQTAVALLTSGVPHLESVVLAVPVEIFDVEVDADCVLTGKAGTLWASSKRLVV